MIVPRILFAFDAQAFGGHEITALKAIERLLYQSDLIIGVLHTGRNQNLIDELSALSKRCGRVDVIPVDAPGAVSESFDGLLHGRRTRAIENAIRRWQPHFVINIQGFITLGLCILGACRALRIPVVSYVPMTHRIWALKPSIISFLQDILNRFWYSVPYSFITISRSMKQMLVDIHGILPDKVTVVECGPDVSNLQICDRAAARSALGWDQRRTIGIVGRVEFFQKRQDFLIKTVAQHRANLAENRFIIIGDGPDYESALSLVKRLGIGDMVQFMGWQKDMSGIYSALDVLLIPSRYEGVPLVMLEAMLWRLPVLASDVDGMKDLLPSECLFRSGDGADLIEKLLALTGRLSPDTIARLSGYIINDRNERNFCDMFAAEIMRLRGCLSG